MAELGFEVRSAQPRSLLIAALRGSCLCHQSGSCWNPHLTPLPLPAPTKATSLQLLVLPNAFSTLVGLRVWKETSDLMAFSQCGFLLCMESPHDVVVKIETRLVRCW